MKPGLVRSTEYFVATGDAPFRLPLTACPLLPEGSTRRKGNVSADALFHGLLDPGSSELPVSIARTG